MPERDFICRRPNSMLSRTSVIWICWAVCYCWLSSAHAHIPVGVDVTMRMASKSFDADQPILLEITYRNTTNQALELLTWNTALEGRIADNFLKVTQDGDELPYSGWHIKRAAAKPQERILLQPNRSVSATIDLLDAYPINAKGEYQVRYRFGDDRPDAVLETQQFTLKENRPITVFKPSQTFVNCENRSNHASIINSAIASAESISRKARDDLRNTPVETRASAQRYLEWFGAYSASRWNRVQNNLDKIYNAARNANLTFECEDDEFFFAAVIKSQPYKIYLGQAFWSAPLNGTDSKAGTIVHELSHFTIIADTDDHVYGQSGARNLANSNPNLAVDNADSQEYFAENTPFLSMPRLDLAISSAELSRSLIGTGLPGQISFNVKNSGNVASTATMATLYVSEDTNVNDSNETLASDTIDAINAGSDEEITLQFRAPRAVGKYFVSVCAEPIQGEATASNNCSPALPLRVVNTGPPTTGALMLLLEEDESL